MKKGAVYLGDCRCGTIVQDEGSFRFWYTEEWLAKEDARPVSLTLPLQKEAHESNTLFPFFDGLIPEGYLLQVAIRAFGLNGNDRMGLLLKTCHDCIGNVSVYEEADHA